MVVLINAESPFFDRATASELFELNREKLDTPRQFEEMLNVWFFNIHDGGHFIGCIFCYVEDGRIWVGGFARRKCHRECLAALNEVKRQFPALYAHTRQKAAEFILRKAGFQRESPEIWKFQQDFEEENIK